MSSVWILAFMFLGVQSEQQGVGFVGVGYNLLTGNPDGGYSAQGGVDPGLLYTRKIFDISLEKNSNQLVIEDRRSCAQVETTHLFYGTKSYQDKLSVNVETSGSADVGLVGFSFSLSARYSKLHTQTKSQTQVFKDDQNICNLGRLRFADELGKAEGFSVSENFAAAVCRLPLKYQKDQYMQFVDQWGTHVTIEVEIGKKVIKRYQSSLTEFVDTARSTVGGGVSAGGSYMGYGASLSVDFEKVKESSSKTTKFGSYKYTLQAGTEEQPEPIGLKVVTIDAALQSKYWQNIAEFVNQNLCSNHSVGSIKIWKANIIKALGEYASYKMAPTPKDPELKIPLTWPEGSYGLMKTKSGCPGGRFKWNEGWRYEDLEDWFNKNKWPKYHHFAGKFGKNMHFEYCIKGKVSISEYDLSWPKGDFCLLKYGTCPQGFSQGFIYFNDENYHNKNSVGGTVPDGKYDRNTKMFYCCRNDGLPTTEIALPNDKPFYLLRYTRGCQQVSGMRVTEEVINLDTEDIRIKGDKKNGAYPFETGRRSNIELHYCYYSPLSKIKFPNFLKNNPFFKKYFG